MHSRCSQQHCPNAFARLSERRYKLQTKICNVIPFGDEKMDHSRLAHKRWPCDENRKMSCRSVRWYIKKYFPFVKVPPRSRFDCVFAILFSLCFCPFRFFFVLHRVMRLCSWSVGLCRWDSIRAHSWSSFGCVCVKCNGSRTKCPENDYLAFIKVTSSLSESMSAYLRSSWRSPIGAIQCNGTA